MFDVKETIFERLYVMTVGGKVEGHGAALDPLGPEAQGCSTLLRHRD